MRRVHPSIMWAKLEALAAGAKIASKALFGGGKKRAAAKPARAKSATVTKLKARASAAKRRPAKASSGHRQKAAANHRGR